MISKIPCYVFLIIMAALLVTGCKRESAPATDRMSEATLQETLQEEETTIAESNIPTTTSDLTIHGEVHNITANGFQLNQAEIEGNVMAVKVDGDTSNFIDIEFAETVTYQIKTISADLLSDSISAGTSGDLAEGASVELEGTWNDNTFITNKIIIWKFS